MTAGSAQHEGEPGWFTSPQQVNQRRYEALRAYFVDGLPYAEAGARFGYTRWAMINLVREHRASLSNSLCKLGQSLSFCYITDITAGSFRRPGQKGTRSGNVTANAFMAAFQPRVPVPRCPLSRTSPSPSMWRPVIFLIPR